MRQLLEDCLEFMLRTVGGVFLLLTIVVLIVLALFWPQAEPEPLPWLGVVGSNVDPKTVQAQRLPFSEGVVIERVFSNSPADYSNLAAGDVIVKFNNRIVFDESQLRNLIFDMDPDEKVWMTVCRDGKYYNVTMKLAAKPTNETLPAQAAAFWSAAGGPTTLTANSPSAQTMAGAAPPIAADAPLPHTYRGVCSNCHVVVSKSQGGQPNTQLVAGMRPIPNAPRSYLGPGANTPGAFSTIALEEYTWAGITVETFNSANAAAMGLPPNIAGVQVDEVLRGSRGEQAGVMGRDLIREVNGVPIYDADSFSNLVNVQKLTGAVLLVNRSGKSMYITVPEL